MCFETLVTTMFVLLFLFFWYISKHLGSLRKKDACIQVENIPDGKGYIKITTAD